MAVFRLSATRRALLGSLAPAMAGMIGAPRRAGARVEAAPMAGFPGTHQPGIMMPPPPVALFVAFDVLAGDPSGLRGLMRLLADRAATLAGADVMLTLAVGASLFDSRFGLQALCPRHLGEDRPMTWEGDLLLTIGASLQDKAVDALRDLAGVTHDLLAPRWKLDGFGPDRSQGAPLPLLEPWIGPQHHDEPAWTHGGSYLVLRRLRHFVELRARDDRPHAVVASPDRIYAYDQGIDAAGQFDMGEIRCRYLAEPCVPEPASDPERERCCGGGRFLALPGVRDLADGFGRSLLGSG